MLLLGRLKLEGKEQTRACGQAGVAWRRFGVPFRQLLLRGGAFRKLVEITSGPSVLLVRPRLDRRIVIFLQPLIGIFHGGALVLIADRFLERF